MSTALQFGLTPKTKPLSPKRSAMIAALDVGTSKVACLIARLRPYTPQDALRRRTHSIEVIGFGHTLARGMKAGAVIDLVEVEQALRQALDLAERAGGCLGGSWRCCACMCRAALAWRLPRFSFCRASPTARSRVAMCPRS